MVAQSVNGRIVYPDERYVVVEFKCDGLR